MTVRLACLLLVLGLAACGQRIVPATTPVPAAGSGELETSLFLIGDAGSPDTTGEPVFMALGQLLARDTARSLVLFLGDNVYPRGLPHPESAEYERSAARLDAQIDLLTARGVRGYLVPGNHDWDRWGEDGWNAIRRQAARVDTRGNGLVRLLPDSGCPGPVVLDVRRHLRLVLLDSQWWLQRGPKPRDDSSNCPHFTPLAVRAALEEAVRGADGRNVVVAAHHPLASGGEHGGFFDWRDHLFPLRHAAPWLWLPLPGLGSVYPVSRGLGISSQDIPSGAYGAMRRAFAQAFAGQPPLIYAAGHEHTLQVIEGGPARFQLVSGAGIYRHEGPVTGIPGTLLALQEAGFMRVDVLRDGRVRLGVFTVHRSGHSEEIYSRWLEPLARARPADADQTDSSCGED